MQIGTVPYCNAFPLVHFLPEYLPGAVLSEWYPSAMRMRLADQTIDLAMMPVVELLSFPQGQIVSNCCIACNGAVRSVLLFSRKPIEQIQTISLDTASRSSVTICELILRHFYSLRPEKHRLETNQNPDDCRTEAFLIIGDRALAFQPSDYWEYRYDVGELWKAKTGLPLVFAAWIGCSPKVFDSSIASALEAARDRGLRQIESILDAKAHVLPLNRERISEYYRQSVIYTMGEEERVGLEHFFELCRTT